VIGTGRNAVEDPTGLHLAAPRLAGSAAHPVSSGAHQQRRRGPRRPHQPAHAIIALSDQRSDPSKEHAPCNKAAIAKLRVQAARRQLSACRLHKPHRRRFRVRAGPLASKRRARRSTPLGGRDRARHQPRSLSRGVAGRSPARRGSQRQRSGSGSGEGFPHST
jgi:hypothetical protein